MQLEMPFFGEAKQPEMVSTELIQACKNRHDAIRLCVHLSNYSNDVLSEMLGIDKGHWSRMMQGKAHFPDSKSVDLMRACGNLAPMQYEAHAMGYVLSKNAVESRKAELRAELEALDKMENAA